MVSGCHELSEKYGLYGLKHHMVDWTCHGCETKDKGQGKIELAT